jgi:hypothetical protein
MRARWQSQLIEAALKCLYSIIVVPNARKWRRVNVYRKGPPGNAYVSITRRFVEGVTVPYATKEWHETLYWNIKYCHYYLNFIKSRNLCSACLHECQKRCVESSRNWDWTTLKQPSEHNCAKRKIKAFSPQNYTGEEKRKLLITRVIHYVFRSLIPPRKFVCLPHGYQIKACATGMASTA